MGSPQIDPAVRFFAIKSIFLYTFIRVRPTQLLALLFKNDGIIGDSNIYLLERREVVNPFHDCIIDASS